MVKWQPKFTRGISQLIPNKTPSLAAILAIALIPTSLHASCALDKLSLRGTFGHIDFSVEIADTPDTRATGLMHRENLGQLESMLFIYERPQRVAFWMRNTLIPLDMLFIDPDGTIAQIHENAIPHDETAIPGGEGRLAVLEINGGLSAQLGITPGSVIRHPKMPQDIAIWPCEAS